MLPYLIKRLGSLIVSLFVASLVIFACIEIVPGDPASFMLGVNAQPDTVNIFFIKFFPINNEQNLTNESVIFVNYINLFWNFYVKNFNIKFVYL